MENRFSVEEQYRFYLEKIGLKEETMHPLQKIQIKQTFFGAWGQLLLLLHDDIADLEEDDIVEALRGMTSQVADFWEGEVFKNKEN